MPRILFLLLCPAFLLEACESPSGKISDMQHRLLNCLTKKEYFEIKAKTGSVRLPLPLSSDESEQLAHEIVQIREEARLLDQKSLADDDKERLTILLNQLEQLTLNGMPVLLNPEEYVLTRLLKGEEKPELRKAILKKVPEYYAEVERRWRFPNPANARLALEQSVEMLHNLEDTGESDSLAKRAIKDFVAMCNSAVCLE